MTPRPSLPVVASCSEREDELAGVTAESGAAWTIVEGVTVRVKLQTPAAPAESTIVPVTI